MPYNSRDTIYELYHKDFGIVKGTKKELAATYPELGTNLLSLLTGKGRRRHFSLHGWRLAENKDVPAPKNGTKPKIHRFYHPNIGEVECTSKELWENYLKDSKYSKERVTAIGNGYEKIVGGWRLASNKEYQHSTEKKYILTHPKHGRQTLTRKEFLDSYGGTRQGLSLLLLDKLKTYKGWKKVSLDL